MIYAALSIMFWMHAYPLLGEMGGGWALEFSRFLGPKWLHAISQGPTPLPLPLVMYMHASKTLCTGLNKSKVHKWLKDLETKIFIPWHNPSDQI